MKNTDKEKKFERTRRIKILEKIKFFIEEARTIRTYDSCNLWRRRIIDFIDNEFPRKKKYQKTKIILESMVSDKSYNPTISVLKEDILRILVDLADMYDLDTPNEFNIILHPKVKEHSLNLFKNGHYAQAIFESVKALNNYVKDKAQIVDKDLSDAMAKAFNEKNPIIKLNDMKTQSKIDEQRGFKFLFMGAMTGIRNPKAHDTIKQEDKNRTLEYLAFLSLLFRRAEEGKL